MNKVLDCGIIFLFLHLTVSKEVLTAFVEKGVHPTFMQVFGGLCPTSLSG